MDATLKTHYDVVIVGAGQAGLSVSASLSARGINHVLLEKNTIAHSWRTQRWDSFCLVTPNWQCQLREFPYAGPEPEGFMPRDEIVSYIEAFADHIKAPVKTGIAVDLISKRDDGTFSVATKQGQISAYAVVLAVSGYHKPNIPKAADLIPTSITQIHSSTYRSPDQMPPGSVLVVGSGQSGCQIAEDLHLAGRNVHLVVGSAPRCPRVYRGRDSVAWLADLGQYDLPVDQHPKKEGVRRQANHYLTGRDGGRDIDLRRFASEGMQLHGRLTGVGPDGILQFADDLRANLDNADNVYNGICGLIDKYIADNNLNAPEGLHYEPVWQPADYLSSLSLADAGITSIIWATGFQSDWSFVDLPIFDDSNYPIHVRGITPQKGLYLIGLPWLYTWGSGRFVGIARDAEHIAAHLVDNLTDNVATHSQDNATTSRATPRSLNAAE